MTDLLQVDCAIHW